MEATEILAQARAPEPPDGWVILPISRRKLAIGLVGWAFGILLGLGLFAVIGNIVIPYDYERGIVGAILSTLLLALFLFIGLGSLWTLIVDIGRLRHADEHLIVITSEDFVKQEGKKIVHVPLAYVRYVTARGKPPIDRTAPTGSQIHQIPGAGERFVGFLFGRGVTAAGMEQRRKRMRTPTSLAFIDTRTDSEVTVVSDEAFGDPFLIAAVLKQHAASKQQPV